MMLQSGCVAIARRAPARKARPRPAKNFRVAKILICAGHDGQQRPPQLILASARAAVGRAEEQDGTQVNLMNRASRQSSPNKYSLMILKIPFFFA